MNGTIRLALIGASILALSSPVLARNAKSDRMPSHTAVGTGGWAAAPVSMRNGAYDLSGPAYGSSSNAGYDRASSPYAGGTGN